MEEEDGSGLDAKSPDPDDEPGTASSQEGDVAGNEALLQWATERFGEELAIVSNGEEEVGKEPMEKVLRKKARFVLVYFSGRWCPLSLEFDTVLKSAYLGMQVIKKTPVELVWVSCDVSEKAYVEHLRQLTFYAVPWVPYQLDSLARQYDVNSIPTLLVMDAKGRLVTDLGRDHIMQHQSGTGDVLTEDLLQRWNDLYKEKLEQWKLEGDPDAEEEDPDPGLALMADLLGGEEPDSPAVP
jgi:hypothetical protein